MDDFCDACRRVVGALWSLSSRWSANSNGGREDFMSLQQWEDSTACRLCLLWKGHSSVQGRCYDAIDQGDKSARALQCLYFSVDGITWWMILEGIKGAFSTIYAREIRIHEENHKDHFIRTHLSLHEGDHRHESESFSSKTWSPTTIRQVEFWLETCLHSPAHHFCQGAADASRLPLRLLDVNPEGKHWSTPRNSQDVEHLSTRHMPSVRLASSSDLAADTRYLTLSHCWGGTPSIVLTAATKARFHEAIPPALLQAAAAAVFSDAIHITRCLGFRYLWIDAICIAQDDGAEKDSEIAAMHEIYSNAVLNLSATCAGQGADGMIRERNGHSVVPYFRTMGPRENTAHGRRSGEMVFFADKWVAEVQSGPVNTRGWVFQERILAPRILHFGSSQLYWECGTLEASETHPTAAENSRMPLISIDLKKSLRKVARGSVWEPARCLELWGKLLSGYTNTRLTFPGDKLVAMSAIAHTFGDRFGMQPDDYACGLWKPHLPQACLWMISRQETRPASYRSPTWSWASVDGMVPQIHPHTGMDLVELVDVSVKRKSQNPFGEVLDASLRLRGRMFKHTLRPVVGTTEAGAGGERAGAGEDEQPAPPTAPDMPACSYIDTRDALLIWDAKDDNLLIAPPASTHEETNVVEYYYSLPFGAKDGIPSGPFQGYGILLRRTAGKGRFTRVAFYPDSASIAKPPKKDDAPPKLWKIQSWALDEDDFLDRGEDGKCTVEIV